MRLANLHSNTTNVKVKLMNKIVSLRLLTNSNTTNVKVKLLFGMALVARSTDSNTTNVKVKLARRPNKVAFKLKFKYNQC